jgi:hypothetical protein
MPGDILNLDDAAIDPDACNGCDREQGNFAGRLIK